MSFLHKKNVTKFMGHHYAIWVNDSNILLAQIIFFRASLWLSLISGTGYATRVITRKLRINNKCGNRSMSHLPLQIACVIFFSLENKRHFKTLSCGCGHLGFRSNNKKNNFLECLTKNIHT
jgi:hypothetical protein